MWPKTFADRLHSWASLRANISSLPKQQCLEEINRWWFRAKWTPYYLHWDDRSAWPDPWQLLDDDIFCPLARALGIMYTIVILERNDMQDAVLVDNKMDNLVLVERQKYILNWDPDRIVNINLDDITQFRSLDQQQFNHII